MSKFLEELKVSRPELYQVSENFINKILSGEIKKRTLPNTFGDYPIDVAEKSFMSLTKLLKGKSLFDQCTVGVHEEPLE